VNDEQQIRNTIQAYFDSMFESSADKVNEAFHASARITGYIEGELHEMTRDEFAGFVASQQPSPQSNGETLRAEVVSIDIAGDTAIAWLRDDYLGLTFLDSISLLRADGRWQIYNKLFHVEGPAG
jgi:hypothetical protein